MNLQKLKIQGPNCILFIFCKIKGTNLHSFICSNQFAIFKT